MSDDHDQVDAETAAVELARQQWARELLATLSAVHQGEPDAWAAALVDGLSRTWHKVWMAGYDDAQRGALEPSGDPFWTSAEPPEDSHPYLPATPR